MAASVLQAATADRMPFSNLLAHKQVCEQTYVPTLRQLMASQRSATPGWVLSRSLTLAPPGWEMGTRQVVRALMKHNRVSEAVRLVAEMRAAGYVPGLGIYRAVLCAPAMSLHGSLQLLERLSGTEGGCGGDVALYEAAAELYARWGEREMAQEMQRIAARLEVQQAPVG